MSNKTAEDNFHDLNSLKLSIIYGTVTNYLFSSTVQYSSIVKTARNLIVFLYTIISSVSIIEIRTTALYCLVSIYPHAMKL